jgi:hypothetical protein
MNHFVGVEVMKTRAIEGPIYRAPSDCVVAGLLDAYKPPR